METPCFSPDGTLRNGWKVLLFIVLAGVADTVAATFRLAVPWLGDASRWIPAPWFSFLAVFLLTWAFLYVEGRPLPSIGLRLNRRWGYELLLGLLAGTGLMATMALVVFLGGGFHLVRNPQALPWHLAAAAWLYLAVACSEELLFRGYVYQRLEQGIGQWPALTVLALLFAGLHWGNPGMTGATRAWASLNIAIAAILLGLCYVNTRSLALPIGLHLGWNWTQGALFGFGVSGIPSSGWWLPVLHDRPVWFTGGAFGLEASLPCAILCAGACLVLLGHPGRPLGESLEREPDCLF